MPAVIEARCFDPYPEGVNQVILIRGFVLLGEGHMNISDRLCLGRGIELEIKSKATLNHKDIHRFYVQMNHQGRKGFATITGLFQADPDPLTPYVLNIQHVKDVTPRSVRSATSRCSTYSVTSLGT